MNSENPSGTANRGIALPLATLGLAAWKSIPSLSGAWENDLYARGALFAFVIWLLPQIYLFFRTATHSGNMWVAVSLFLCVAGSLSGLRVLHHLALASSFSGLFGQRYLGVIILASSLAWLPATGWFLSHWKTSGLLGWERPTIALMVALSLLCLSFRTNSSIVCNER